MIRYGIIQLSDLQFGKKHRFGNPSNIHKYLTHDINFMAEKYQFIPIYLLITGDITEQAHAEEFDEASNTINILASEISIDRDSIICVPGNHDINWKLSEVAEEVGDPNLKYNNYNKFVTKTCNSMSIVKDEYYQTIIDHRLGIEFLLLNSCEEENFENHFGHIDKEKLIRSIDKSRSKEKYTKICLCHHRIEEIDKTMKSKVDNSQEIQNIIISNGYDIILTGHIHENRIFEIKISGHNILYSGAGSVGVDKSQREDGIQNQYTIHVLDSYNKKIESYWRAFNPKKRSRLGLGGWGQDNSTDDNPSIFNLDKIVHFDTFSTYSLEDYSLIEKFNIKRNPFTFSNAEKISTNQILDLFVSSEGRNKTAVRLTGDAIIRGIRGSGKTMLLKYLDIFGNITFDENVKHKRVSESLPVMVNLSLIHKSERERTTGSVMQTAERLIFESVLNTLFEKEKELQSPEFRKALFRVREKLKILENQEGNVIWKLGVAISENMMNYFSHILLLIDEVASLFPKEFFQDEEDGFIKWMNSIRNSGPYFTRIAVYPNNISDVLNEDRFGAIVNLDYNVKNQNDYNAYRKYCIDLVNKYLKMVSVNHKDPVRIDALLNIDDESGNDGLEQLIYASDGSSRRFTSLMDKCLTFDYKKNDSVLNKDQVIEVIKEFSSNLLSGYDLFEKELAQSIAKVCRRQTTYRFRIPGFSSILTNLYAKNEELNIVKLEEVGRGKRGTTYELTYPYCILMDVQTHYIRDTRKICISRNIVEGEWITPVTTIKKEQLDYLNKELRIEGVIVDIDDDLIIINDYSDNEYLSEFFDEKFKIGEIVSFININGIASDIIRTHEPSLGFKRL